MALAIKAKTVLSYANLSSANLSSAKNLKKLWAAITSITPDGDLIGWKKCHGNIIVKLLIPTKAERSNATGRKCRCSFAVVEKIYGAKEAISLHDGEITYREGETIACDKWEENRFIECGGGIHFYITRDEAEAHN